MVFWCALANQRGNYCLAQASTKSNRTLQLRAQQLPNYLPLLPTPHHATVAVIAVVALHEHLRLCVDSTNATLATTPWIPTPDAHGLIYHIKPNHAVRLVR